MLKELIIKVNNEAIYLNPTLTVSIQQTNIPIQFCKFRTYEEIFWKVELLDYNETTRCWRMNVVDYFPDDIKNFSRQKSTKEVERIAFEKFNWPQFERHLSNYQKIKLLDLLNNHDADRFFREEPARTAVPDFTLSEFKQQYPVQFAPHEQEPAIKTVKVEFSVYFSDAHFMLGYVAFQKRIREVDGAVNFRIHNDFLLAEFENIKSWFAKKLKSKKFKVNATITTVEGKVTDVTASSPQIELIDAALVDSIKYQRTISLSKPARVAETDKALFTAEEIFGEIESEDIEGNVFKQNEQDILSFLLDHYKIRNRKQLEYLSGKKQSENSKLRFTLHPNFGFLFFIEGKEHNHFVWELLNSHATYLWSIEKPASEMEVQYKRIEASINTIRDTGREQYKRAYRQNHHDNDLMFSVIEHDDISSNFVDGFAKWKHKLNEKLT